MAEKPNIRDVDIDILQPIKVEVSEYRGQTNLQVRHWWKPKEHEDLVRTKKGITIPLDDTLVLIQVMLDSYNEATEQHFAIVEIEE